MYDFNERTNTLLYKNVPLTLYSKGLRKGWCWLCVRGELETGTDCYILTQSSSDPSSTSFSSWLGCSTVGHWGPKPSVCKLILTLASCPPTDFNSNWNSNSNWLTQAVCGTWLYNCLTYTCFLWSYHGHRSRWYSDIFDRMHLFRYCSAYLHRCISWLTARSGVNMLQNERPLDFDMNYTGIECSYFTRITDNPTNMSWKQTPVSVELLRLEISSQSPPDVVLINALI